MTENIPRRERIVTLLCVASFLACTLFLFGPLHLYFTNRTEFHIGALDIIPLFAAVCIAVAGVVTLVFLPLPSRLFTRAVAFLFMIAVLLWLQGNVLVWRVGVLDGREIPWSSHRIYGFVDSALWAALLAVALVKSGCIYRIARRASTAFLVIQLISTAVTAARAPEGLNFYRYASDETDKFAFSKKQNVIILVLDGFQSDIFQELVNQDNRYRDVFSGFTYFRNALGGYPLTHPSVPLILTGKYYDNSVPIKEFIETAYSTCSLPLALRREGWRVYLPLHYAIFNDEAIASNVKKKMPSPLRAENMGYAAEIYDAALLRHAPYFAKKYLYNRGRGFLQRQYALATRLGGGRWYEGGDWGWEPTIEFIEDMARRARVNDESGTFSYFHLVGLHPPLTLNENLGYEEMPFTRDNYVRQARAMLKITEKFIAKLRTLGVYDSSMILVIGDHGSGFPLPNSFCTAQGRGARRGGGRHPIVSDRIIPLGVPLFMVKPFNADGAMRVSDAPVTLGDIPATVASALGVAHAFPGGSVFTRQESEARERRFLFYYWGHEWTAEYLPIMTEYAVRGPSGCRDSWAPTGRRFSPRSHGAAPAMYVPGTEITFGVGGNYLQYAREGWSVPEDGHTWTEEKCAALEIPLEPPRAEMVIRAILKPWLPPGRMKYQRVTVLVNGEKIGNWKVTPVEKEYRVTIPRRLMKNSPLSVEFLLPDRASPRDAGVGDDRRTLGVAVKSIVIGEEAPYTYGTSIAFGARGNAVHYMESGWSHPEARYAWTSGKRASLRILLGPPISDLVLRAVVMPLRMGGKPDAQRVYIRVNGKRVGEWRVDAKGEYRITIPKGCREAPEALISFDLPDAFSPLARGESDDPRLLGLRFYSVQLVPAEAALPSD